jgi:hypothetical protein
MRVNQMTNGIHISNEINRLADFTRMLGGNFDILTQKEFTYKKIMDDMEVFPSHLLRKEPKLGCSWEDQVIYLCKDDFNLHWRWVLHEIAHVFASMNPPGISEDFKFLGWEYVVAKELKLNLVEWKDTVNYAVPTFSGWPVSLKDLSQEDFDILMTKRVEIAESYGAIWNGIPIAVR